MLGLKLGVVGMGKGKKGLDHHRYHKGGRGEVMEDLLRYIHYLDDHQC